MTEMGFTHTRMSMHKKRIESGLGRVVGHSLSCSTCQTIAVTLKEIEKPVFCIDLRIKLRGLHPVKRTGYFRSNLFVAVFVCSYIGFTLSTEFNSRIAFCLHENPVIKNGAITNLAI